LFYVNSFSKKFSITGWRIGYVMAHQEHMDAIMDIHDYTGLCAPSVLQQALAEYVRTNEGGMQYTQKLRDQLKSNYAVLAKKFTEMGFEVSEAQGGYFVWAKLPTQFNSGLEFALELYEKEKVAVVPGVHFSENAEAFIRINIARYPNEIEQAIPKFTRFIERKA
jgi:aspartate/methionine/tyrosine aminotransferase